jgi:SAM-dependent methyltransferase
VGVESAPLVVCADLVFDMLLEIKANRSGPVACLDARRLPFQDHSFDFIWSGLLIDHIGDPEGWIRELSRVLTPGSTLGMACWNRSELPAERYPENSRMRYTTSRGEELSVSSFPTWEATLGLLQKKCPPVETETFPIVPNEYLLQIAWGRIPA